MFVAADIDQLRIDANLVADLLDAAMKHHAYAQFFTNLVRALVAVAITRYRRSRNHPETRDPLQAGQQVVVDAVGEKNRALALRGAYRERQHRNRTIPDRSEEHTSELQSLMRISYAVFCLKKKKKSQTRQTESD